MPQSIFVWPVVAVFVLGLSPAVLAQHVSGGIKAGVSAARVAGIVEAIDEPVEESSKWGSMAGGFLTVAINQIFAVQPEVLYAMKGSRVVGTPGGVSVELTFDARYLEFPVLARLSPASQKIYVLAGPAIALRLSAESREVGGGVTQTEDVTDQARRVDIGVALGAGAKFRRFFVEGRWTEGLLDAERGDRFDNTVRNRVFAVLAGVHF